MKIGNRLAFLLPPGTGSVYRIVPLKLFTHFPAVAILGPRQIGKTTLAKSLIKDMDKRVVYLDLELPGDLSKLDNPQLFFESNEDSCIIIDEVQRKPDLFPVIRSVIDQHPLYLRPKCFKVYRFFRKRFHSAPVNPMVCQREKAHHQISKSLSEG